MPKTAARSRRSIATVTSTAVISASVAVLLLPVTAPLASAAVAPGSTMRVSVTDKGDQAGGGQASVMSADGSQVAFVSSSKLDNLDTREMDNVYVRDLRTGRTVMISRGTPPPPPSSGPPVVHLSGAKALDLGVPAKQAAQQAAEDSPNGRSDQPTLSADGRYVAFVSRASNIRDVGGGRESKIVVCDRNPDGNDRFDEDRDGRRDYRCFQANGPTQNSVEEPKLSANAGRIVWMEQHGGDALYSRFRTTVLASGKPGTVEEVPADLGIEGVELVQQFDPVISGDGNHIVMHATYVDFGCDCSRRFHAIVSTNPVTKKVTRVDIDGYSAKGDPRFISNDKTEFVMRPATSSDGTVIAFVAEQFFVYDDFGNMRSRFDEPNVYVVHVDYGRDPGKEVVVNPPTRIVSRVYKDKDGNPDESLANGERPALSADGRYIAFVTDSLRMHDGTDGPLAPDGFTCIRPRPISPGLNGGKMLDLAAALPPERKGERTFCQVVMRDLVIDEERLGNEDPRLPGTLVSPRQATSNAGDNDTVPDRSFSTAPSLQSDGGRVAYDSQATNLINNDTNGRIDVFVRTLEPTVQGDAVNFGNVQIGNASTRTARLNEVGFGPVNVENLSIIGANAGDFALGGQTCIGQTIHETGFCEVSVRFTPAAEGTRNAQLLVQMRGNRRATVNLTGTGSPIPPDPPQFAAGPNPLNFGNRLLLSDGPTLPVTVTNNGEAPLQVNPVDIVGPGNPEDYRIASSTCNAPVPGGQQCTVNIAFSPKGSGNRNAVLRFSDNAPGGPHLVGLQGSANQPTITISPGVTPPARVVTVTGKDFPPGHVVTVKFDGRPGLTTIKAKDDGTFQSPLLVFPKASPETRTVLATVPDFADPLARGTLLIVFPTVSPANFVVRG